MPVVEKTAPSFGRVDKPDGHRKYLSARRSFWFDLGHEVVRWKTDRPWTTSIKVSGGVIALGCGDVQIAEVFATESATRDQTRWHLNDSVDVATGCEPVDARAAPHCHPHASGRIHRESIRNSAGLGNLGESSPATKLPSCRVELEAVHPIEVAVYVVEVTVIGTPTETVRYRDSAEHEPNGERSIQPVKGSATGVGEGRASANPESSRTVSLAVVHPSQHRLGCIARGKLLQGARGLINPEEAAPSGPEKSSAGCTANGCDRTCHLERRITACSGIITMNVRLIDVEPYETAIPTYPQWPLTKVRASCDRDLDAYRSRQRLASRLVRTDVHALSNASGSPYVSAGQCYLVQVFNDRRPDIDCSDSHRWVE
jgi:hypothetical protein